MEVYKTILDDLAAVIGFAATTRLSAWFGDGTGNLYVPLKVEEGQLVVRLIGLPAARKLVEAWGGEHLAIPRLRDYEDDVKKRIVGRMLESGMGTREVSGHMRMSERRVQQICKELELAGLIEIVGPAKKRGGKLVVKSAPEKSG